MNSDFLNIATDRAQVEAYNQALDDVIAAITEIAKTEYRNELYTEHLINVIALMKK